MATKSEHKTQNYATWRTQLQAERLRAESRKAMAQQSAAAVSDYDNQIKALDDLIAFCDSKLANP